MPRDLIPFEKCVRYLYLESLITEPLQLGTNLFSAFPTFGVSWGAIARELAFHLPGSTAIMGNSTGVSWTNGANSPHGIIMELDQYHKAQDARAVAVGITGVALDKCYSIGKAARHLLQFVGRPHLDSHGNAPKSAERFLDGITYGFHACKPGEYEDYTMYDVKGYYYDLLKRLPTLRLTADDEGVLPEPMTRDESARWREVLEGIEDNKDLRNSLSGVCAGSNRWGTIWTYDKKAERVVRKQKPPRPGFFRGAGLLVVHTGTVLCRTNHLTSQSVYSTIDCITVPTGTLSQWERLGFRVVVKTDKAGNRASGNAVIAQRGSYKIASVVTEPYKKGIRDSVLVEGCGEPPINYARYLMEGF